LSLSLGAVERSFAKRGVAGSARVLGMLAALAALVVYSEPTPTSCALGLPVIAFGLWWRIWAGGHLVKNIQLVVSGPYRHVQNPLYFGRLCLLTGLCLSARWMLDFGGWNLPVHLVALGIGWLLFFTYYLPRKKRVEGNRLEAIHGEVYRNWAQAVPLIVPRIAPWGDDTCSWSSARFAEMRELPFVLAIVAVCLALCARALGASG